MNRRFSLNFILGVVITLVILCVVSINTFISYSQTKDKLYNQNILDANIITEELIYVLPTYMESYSLNEYKDIIRSQMKHKSIFAIVLKDDNMAMINGKDSFIVGNIKNQSHSIEDFDLSNSLHTKMLNNSLYLKKSNIISNSQKIGELNVYTTDYFVKEELKNIIVNNIKTTSYIYLILALTLYFLLRYFIINPINEIIDTIDKQHGDGIPTKEVPILGALETASLANTINSMINSIRKSKEQKVILSNHLEEKTKELQKVNESLEQKIEQALEQNTKQLQTLQQQSKMASMGEMIGAIAHQWRQPLNEVSISIQNTKYDFKNGEIDETYIKTFIDENKKVINFMSKTIDDFRSFFRVDKEKREFGVKETTEAVIAMQSAQLKDHKIRVEISGDEFVYNGFKSEYQQVILNIINNAKDALIEKAIENPLINIELKENKVIISDNAGGIAQEILERVFEPYFTTKEQGKGTGMGLYMSKMIIEDNMGAKLSVKNSSDGAIFSIDFRGESHGK